MADRRADVERLFTHRWKLEQAEEAYRLFDTQTTGKASIARRIADAMRIAVEIGARTEALSEHWCLRGSGLLSGRQVAEIAGRYLGREVRLRSAGTTTLRIFGLFNKDLPGLLQVAPDYMKPVRYDTRKLQGLLGLQQMTSYDAGIGHTHGLIASRH